jgi:hypothetical protein
MFRLVVCSVRVNRVLARCIRRLNVTLLSLKREELSYSEDSVGGHGLFLDHNLPLTSRTRIRLPRLTA